MAIPEQLNAFCIVEGVRTVLQAWEGKLRMRMCALVTALYTNSNLRFSESAYPCASYESHFGTVFFYNGKLKV
jgi:hypothetical protein